MKYIIVIDTDKKDVYAYSECPTLLRLGGESDEELASRREVRRRCAEPCPDWIEAAVKELSNKL